MVVGFNKSGMRSGEQIARDMLVALTEQPLTRTQLMWRAFLSYTQLKEKEIQLVKRKMIKIHDKKYHVTPLGAEFIQTMEKLESIGKL